MLRASPAAGTPSPASPSAPHPSSMGKDPTGCPPSTQGSRTLLGFQCSQGTGRHLWASPASVQNPSLELPAYLALALLLRVPFAPVPSSRVPSWLLCRDHRSDTGCPVARWQPGAGLQTRLFLSPCISTTTTRDSRTGARLGLLAASLLLSTSQQKGEPGAIPSSITDHPVHPATAGAVPLVAETPIHPAVPHSKAYLTGQHGFLLPTLPRGLSRSSWAG